MPKLWELPGAIEEATEALDRAARMAYELSGDEPGRAGEPCLGIPAVEPVEGWPAMLQLCGVLTELKERLAVAMPDEVAAAIKQEHDAAAEYDR